MTSRTLASVFSTLAAFAVASSACSDGGAAPPPGSGAQSDGVLADGTTSDSTVTSTSTSTSAVATSVGGGSTTGGTATAVTNGVTGTGGASGDTTGATDGATSATGASGGASASDGTTAASTTTGEATTAATTTGAGGTGASADTGTMTSDTGSSGSGGSAGNGSDVTTAQPIGFASLNGGTSGGQGGQTVTVSTYADLKSYAESSGAYIIMVDGTISNGANGGVVAVASNKSIIGVGSTAFLYGVGLDINNSNNIILRNLRVSMTGVTTRTDTAGVYTSSDDDGLPKILVNDGDAIGIRGSSKNIWIDHCELFSEDPDVQTNHDLYDGLIDIKNQTGFITISWNYLHDHHKGGLVGSSDSDLFDDRKITFHHNYYDNVKLRIPMYRGSVGHFFNNYIVKAEDASEIRADTCVRVEKNYYEALHYSIYTPSDAPGKTERIDNIEVSRSSRAYPDDCTADIPYDYSQALTTVTDDVKTVVPQSAGVGKI